MPLLVRHVEGVHDLSRDGQSVIQRNGAARDLVGQRLTLDELEHQRAHAVSVFQSIDRADVWMIE